MVKFLFHHTLHSAILTLNTKTNNTLKLTCKGIVRCRGHWTFSCPTCRDAITFVCQPHKHWTENDTCSAKKMCHLVGWYVHKEACNLTWRYFLLKHQCLGTGTELRHDWKYNNKEISQLIFPVYRKFNAKHNVMDECQTSFAAELHPLIRLHNRSVTNC